jgi:transposase
MTLNERALPGLCPANPPVRRGFRHVREAIVAGWNRDALVTCTEAAWLLKVSPSTVYNWVTTRKLEPDGHRGRAATYKYGRLVDISRETRLTVHSSRNTERLGRPDAQAA